MKWFVGSDLHGSALYIKKMLAAYGREDCDRLLLLGDLLYHGPRNNLPGEYDTKKAAALLNRYRKEIFAVRGNCDSEVDQMVLDFPIMAEYAIVAVGKRLVFATHGHIFHNGHLPPLQTGDILLHGHTHIPACEEHSSHLYWNPGSVSLPKGGSPHGYMVVDGEEICWKDLDGATYRTFHLEE